MQLVKAQLDATFNSRMSVSPFSVSDEASLSLKQAVLQDEITTHDDWLSIVRRCQGALPQETIVDWLAAVTVSVSLRNAQQHVTRMERLKEEEEKKIKMQELEDKKTKELKKKKKRKRKNGLESEQAERELNVEEDIVTFEDDGKDLTWQEDIIQWSN